MFQDFELLLADLLKLNVKYLQVLLTDLRSTGYIPPWSGEYHKTLQHRIELSIIERTVLK